MTGCSCNLRAKKLYMHSLKARAGVESDDLAAHNEGEKIACLKFPKRHGLQHIVPFGQS